MQVHLRNITIFYFKHIIKHNESFSTTCSFAVVVVLR